ncbi:hypothetical protein TWF481_005881 [Arthrobotrys musiformis]|uniref:Nucleoside phosphorylase domain-containing protein n=1 Tax=Arthrobotrys musiformis TaxID=47236 RepID=A0AAV9WGH2_9PEZI
MSDGSKLNEYHEELYTILIVCPLNFEGQAMRNFFDEEHEPNSQSENDSNHYYLGRIGRHLVVMVVASDAGNLPVVVIENNARWTFKNITYALLVGIGAGIPGSDVKIELGDVVLGKRIRHYDSRKVVSDEFESNQLTDHLNNPSTRLHQIAGMVSGDLRAQKAIADILQKNFPDQEFGTPKIHHGTIASGDAVVKNAKFRDKIRDATGAICIEMEAAGLAKPYCLTIRGICDFADENKDDTWQDRAAQVAAAAATYILRKLIPSKESEAKIKEYEQKHGISQSITQQQPWQWENASFDTLPPGRPRRELDYGHSQNTAHQQRFLLMPIGGLVPGLTQGGPPIGYRRDINPLEHQRHQNLVSENPLAGEWGFPHTDDGRTHGQFSHSIPQTMAPGSRNNAIDFQPAHARPLSDENDIRSDVVGSINSDLMVAKICLVELQEFIHSNHVNESRTSMQTLIDSAKSAALGALSSVPKKPDGYCFPELAGYAKVLHARVLYNELNIMWYDEKENTEEFGERFRDCYKTFTEGRYLLDHYPTSNKSNTDYAYYKKIGDRLAQHFEARGWAVEARKRWLQKCS